MAKTLEESLDAPRLSMDVDGLGSVACYADDRVGGRPLLLLHSINASPTAREVAPLFDSYRQHRPVFALELPGFGFSDRPNIDYSPELYARCLREFCEHQFDQPVDVVALSTTAEFVARAALEAPRLFNSLVLVSPTGMGSREPPSGAASERLRKLFAVPVFSAGLYRALTSRASIRFFLGLSFEKAVPVELIDQACATARQPGARYAPFRFLSMALFTPGAADTLYRPLAIPSLVLYDKDPNINFERLPELMKSNPLLRAERIAPSCGLPHWDEPEQTIAALDSFWESRTSP